MSPSLYSIPGSTPGVAPAISATDSSAAAVVETQTAQAAAHTVSEVLAQSQAGAVIDELDRDLVGLAPIKARIRDIAALLVIDKLRMNLGLSAAAPSLHMSFTGNPGTGKTKEVLKRAMGGVLFIDEAYYLYRPENERDYGQEAIEILLQVMENQRDDLVVILAGYKERMEAFFRSNPGMSSRIAHHLDFPDYAPADLLRIADKLLERQNYRFAAGARTAFEEYLAHRVRQPHFANARSVRNALDRARLRQASRLFADTERVFTAEELTTIEADDIRASRVFRAAAVAAEI